MIKSTTTSDMIVSWSIAYGKNFFPRSLTSSLYCLKTRWRSWTRSLDATVALRPLDAVAVDAAPVRSVAVDPDGRAREADARAVRGCRRRRIARAAARCVLRPRGRGDA